MSYAYKYPRPAVTADMIVLTDESDPKILLIQRGNEPFKGCWAFPGGFMNMDETTEQCARRELKEETGLDLVRIDQWWGTCYSAIGFSNERNACCVGVAKGTFSKSTSAQEEIQPGWYTKAQVKELLEKEPFAVRTQAYCYCWVNSSR